MVTILKVENATLTADTVVIDDSNILAKLEASIQKLEDLDRSVNNINIETTDFDTTPITSGLNSLKSSIDLQLAQLQGFNQGLQNLPANLKPDLDEVKEKIQESTAAFDTGVTTLTTLLSKVNVDSNTRLDKLIVGDANTLAELELQGVTLTEMNKSLSSAIAKFNESQQVEAQQLTESQQTNELLGRLTEPPRLSTTGTVVNRAEAKAVEIPENFYYAEVKVLQDLRWPKKDSTGNMIVHATITDISSGNIVAMLPVDAGWAIGDASYVNGLHDSHRIEFQLIDDSPVNQCYIIEAYYKKENLAELVIIPALEELPSIPEDTNPLS